MKTFKEIQEEIRREEKAARRQSIATKGEFLFFCLLFVIAFLVCFDFYLTVRPR